MIEYLASVNVSVELGRAFTVCDLLVPQSIIIEMILEWLKFIIEE